MSLVAFVDHPLGETNGEDAIKRADNVANAGEWMRFVKTCFPSLIIVAPWHTYAMVDLPDSSRLVDSALLLERADIYVPCGGIHSPHMRHNLKAARRVGVPIFDLCSYGVLPPDVTEDLLQLLTSRLRKMMTTTTRRVWMPLLTPDDIDKLKRARHALYVHLQDEHDAAVAVLDRILHAASENDG